MNAVLTAENDLSEAFLDYVEGFMLDNDISRSELARRLSVSPARITNLFKGGNITLRTMADVAEVLGLSIQIELLPL